MVPVRDVLPNPFPQLMENKKSKNKQTTITTKLDVVEATYRYSRTP